MTQLISAGGDKAYKQKGIRANYFVYGFGIIPASTSFVMNGPQTRAFPFVIGEAMPVTRAGCYVATAQAGKGARIGMYDIQNGEPKNLLYDFGSIDVSTTGTKEIAISETIPAGIYAMALTTDSTSAAYREPDGASAIVAHFTGLLSAVGGTAGWGYNPASLTNFPAIWPGTTFGFPIIDCANVWLRNV